MSHSIKTLFFFRGRFFTNISGPPHFLESSISSRSRLPKVTSFLISSIPLLQDFITFYAVTESIELFCKYSYNSFTESRTFVQHCRRNTNSRVSVQDLQKSNSFRYSFTFGIWNFTIRNFVKGVNNSWKIFEHFLNSSLMRRPPAYKAFKS